MFGQNSLPAAFAIEGKLKRKSSDVSVLDYKDGFLLELSKKVKLCLVPL